MWNLKKPDISQAKSDLVDVINRSASLTNGHIPLIENLYDHLEIGNGKVPDRVHDLVSHDIRHGLRISYDKFYEGKPLHFIHEELRKDVLECPYCGETIPTTLDHYMPKERYKALSVCRLNLVPMCPDCNRNRDRVNDFRKTFHAYYDIFPNDVRWLKTFISSTSAHGMKVSFYADPEKIDLELADKANYTLREVKIQDYLDKAVTKFLRDLLAGRSFKDNNCLKEFLKFESQRKDKSYGLNHWKSSLLNELYNNETMDLRNLAIYLNP